MANIFNVFKVFRPATTILADDWTQMQLALVASFTKLGDARSDALKGVNTPFACSDPVNPTDAVTVQYMNSNVSAAAQTALDALEVRIVVLENAP
jgi:hypothetical protein|tara:strand:+ start:375 stop:659 length:285 start_codon:yes stop_codon:yes gene_type:complete